MKRLYTLIVIFSLAVSAYSFGRTQELFYVSREFAAEKKTDGRHFYSLAQAVQAARKAGTQKKRIIRISAGQYMMDETIRLDEQDNNLTIKAAPGDKPVLYGGRRITGWKKDGKFWSAKIDKNRHFRLLEVNGRFAERARYPSQGYLKHLSTCELKWLSTVEGGWNKKPTPQQLLEMKYKHGDIPENMDLHNAEITLFHMWDETLVGIKSRDKKNNILKFSHPVAWPVGGWDTHRYVLWNVREGMTEPGRWYLDGTEGKLYYWPMEGEKIADLKVIAPRLKRIFRIEKAKNVTIKGLTIRSTNTKIMVGGFGAKWFDGAISLADVRKCTFENLDISNVSNHAIKGTGRQVTIRRCHLHHTGAAAIRFIGSHSLIQNNRIHDVGLIYPSAIALYVNVTDPNAKKEWKAGKDEGYVKITGNVIYDVPYTALACGGSDTQITSNRIWHAMQVLGDGAGIYITFCKNLILKGNFVSDIGIGRGFGTSAYYLDELTDNALVEGNLAVNVNRPLHCHLCTKNTIRNNVFIVREGDARLTFPRCSDFVLQKNVLHVKGRIDIEGLNVLTTFENNILFSEKGEVYACDIKRHERLERQKLTETTDNLLTDPLVVEYKNGRVVFAESSPAYKLGIKPIDVSPSKEKKTH